MNLMKQHRKQVQKHGADRYPTVELQMLKLGEEFGELAKAMHRYLTGRTRVGTGTQEIRDEMADVALALAGLANKYGIDLDHAIKSKVDRDNRNFKLSDDARSLGLGTNHQGLPDYAAFT